jgi:hypothetical protein
LLCVEAGFLGEKSCKQQEKLVRRAKVAGEEIGQYSAGTVKGSGMRFVGLVPCVFEGCERRGRVLAAEQEVSLGLVRFELYTLRENQAQVGGDDDERVG